MLLKIPPSDSRTNVRQVFQGSDVYSNWKRVREERMISMMFAATFIEAPLHDIVPTDKRRFLEKENHRSTSTNRNRHRKMLASPRSTAVEKENFKEEKPTEAKQKTKSLKGRGKSRGPNYKHPVSKLEHLIVIGVVAIVWAFVAISHPYLHDNVVLDDVTKLLLIIISYYFGSRSAGNRNN